MHTRLSHKHAATLDVGGDTVSLTPVPICSLGFAESWQAQAHVQDGLSLVKRSRSGPRGKDSLTGLRHYGGVLQQSPAQACPIYMINAFKPQLL